VNRLAMERSDSCISAIFASTSASPSVSLVRELWCAASFNSRTRYFIAACSSGVKPLVAVVLLGDF
jgi:hypothetical protein